MSLSPMKWAMLAGLIAFGVVSCVACTQMNDVRESVGLPEYADIGEACEDLPTDDAQASEVREIGDRIACEAYAGLLAYEVAQASVVRLRDAADGSEDDELLEAAATAIDLEQKATPVAKALNRSIDAFIVLKDEAARYREEGLSPPATLLMEMADTYTALRTRWDEAQPIFEELSNL